jgi:E3 ubiquitin-protein ligase SHPRH
MSSRRKRAPPMKVDEERQQQLHWNMHEDLRSEPLTMTVGEQACSDADSSSDCIIIDEGPPESALHRDKKRRSETVSVLEATEEETRLSVTLNVTVSPYRVDNSWKAFLGDFALQLLPKESLVEHFSERTFTLSPSESSSQFLIYVHSECKNVEKQENVLEGSAGVCSKGIRVESSFSSDMLQDLAWLQKRRGIKLYQRPDGTHTIKVLRVCGVV